MRRPLRSLSLLLLVGLPMNGAGPIEDVLLRFPTSGAIRRRLFCLPFAGGGPAAFRFWPRELPSDIEVLAARLPGRSPASRSP